MTSESKRQLLHISVVSFAVLLRFLNAPWAFLLAMTAFIHNILILPKYAPDLFRKKERVFQGIAVYPLVIAILILIFPNNLQLVGAVWAILSFGDGFSNLFGRKWPMARIPWNPDKSLGGMLAFFITATIGAWLFMLWIGPIGSILHLLLIAFWASLVAAIYETLPFPWDDNIVVAITAATTASLLWNHDLLLDSGSITAAWLGIACLVNAIVALAAWFLRLVSTTGAIGGGTIGTIILLLGGINHYIILVLFFVLGTITTKIGYEEKDYKGIAQESGGKRGAKHALANCLFAVLACFAIGITNGFDHVFSIFFTAAFATALGDTISTELGQLYGKSPFMPTTFRRVPPGTVGAISIEGTLFGMGTVVLLAFIAFFLQVIALAHIPAVILGGWLGNYVESYIGSQWTEAGKEIDNEWMNLLNTFLGGSLALFIYTLTVLR